MRFVGKEVRPNIGKRNDVTKQERSSKFGDGRKRRIGKAGRRSSKRGDERRDFRANERGKKRRQRRTREKIEPEKIKERFDRIVGREEKGSIVIAKEDFKNGENDMENTIGIQSVHANERNELRR